MAAIRNFTASNVFFSASRLDTPEPSNDLGFQLAILTRDIGRAVDFGGGQNSNLGRVSHGETKSVAKRKFHSVPPP